MPPQDASIEAQALQVDCARIRMRAQSWAAILDTGADLHEIFGSPAAETYTAHSTAGPAVQSNKVYLTP